MKMNATEFKAKCLSILDRVQSRRQPVTITKRGRVVARLVPAFDEAEQPWLRLRDGRVRWIGDPFAPVVAEDDLVVTK